MLPAPHASLGVLNDVAVGDNYACEIDGFNASKALDLVTGWDDRINQGCWSTSCIFLDRSLWLERPDTPLDSHLGS